MKPEYNHFHFLLLPNFVKWYCSKRTRQKRDEIKKLRIEVLSDYETLSAREKKEKKWAKTWQYLWKIWTIEKGYHLREAKYKTKIKTHEGVEVEMWMPRPEISAKRRLQLCLWIPKCSVDRAWANGLMILCWNSYFATAWYCYCIGGFPTFSKTRPQRTEKVSDVNIGTCEIYRTDEKILIF